MKKNYREVKQQDINRTYEAWEWLLESKVSQLQEFIETVQNDLSMSGMSYSESEAFLEQKINEMRDQLKTQKGSRRGKKEVV